MDFSFLKKILFMSDFLLKLLYVSQACQLCVNLGVVIIAVEGFLSDTLHQYFYGKSGMCVGTKVYTALVIENVCDGYSQRFVASVFYVLFLGEFGFLTGSCHGRIVSCL